jgi:hypothetical protein
MRKPIADDDYGLVFVLTADRGDYAGRALEHEAAPMGPLRRQLRSVRARKAR